MDEQTKRCATCRRELPLSAFGVENRRLDGRHHECKECVAAYQRIKRSVSKEEMLVAQNGLCAACTHPFEPGARMVLDHCHRTGRVRGLIHENCNHGLGKFNDSPVALIKGAFYLMRFELAYLAEKHPILTSAIRASRDVFAFLVKQAREMHVKFLEESERADIRV